MTIEETGHGDDRRAAEAAHDSAGNAAGAGNARAGSPGTAATVYSPGTAGGPVAHPGNGTPLDYRALGQAMGAHPYSYLNALVSAQQAQQRRQNARALQNSWAASCTVSTGVSYTPQPRTPPKPLEHAGITLGEIIAWRIWRVRPDGFLRSASADSIWVPGEPMQGDIGSDYHEQAGVHAWKTAALALKYGGSDHGPSVIGEIALWGEVVEHELGYRAEFGKPVSFKWAMGDGAKGRESVWTKVMRRRASDVEAAMQVLRDLYGATA